MSILKFGYLLLIIGICILLYQCQKLSVSINVAWCSHRAATPLILRHTRLLYLWAALLTQSMMEQTSEPPHNNNNSPAGNEPPACGLHSKRLKELENAALQTTLISRMETESGADAGNWTEQQSGEGEQSNGLSLNHRSAPPQLGADTEAEEAESEGNISKERVEEERTLTDHLNKRLLSSFLEKLNERDLALPGVQRLDCAVADEDSNRAADEW